MRYLNRFRCHQWLPDTHVCQRCGVTKEEVYREEGRKLLAALSPYARVRIEMLEKQLDEAVRSEAEVRRAFRRTCNLLLDEMA